MKKFSCLLLLACSLLSLSADAQKMITFESHSKPKGKHHRDGEGSNSLTMGFGSALLNGYLPVFYERKIISFLSVAVGGGVTYRSYMNDLGLAIYDDGQNTDYYPTQDIHDNYANYKYRKSAPGAYFAIAPRIYPRDEAMDGVYVSPMLEYKQYRFTNQIADVTQAPAGYYGYGDNDENVPRSKTTISEHMNCLDLTMNTGGHYQLQNHLAIGWSFGFGVRRLTSERLDLGVQDSGPFSLFVNHVRTYSANRPLFTFNFTMGGWF